MNFLVAKVHCKAYFLLCKLLLNLNQKRIRLRLIGKDNTFNVQKLRFHRDSFRIRRYRNKGNRRSFGFGRQVSFRGGCGGYYIIY